MDIISTNGSIFLGYAGKAQIIGFPVKYSALLQGNIENHISAKYKISVQLPQQCNLTTNSYIWNATSFNIEANWSNNINTETEAVILADTPVLYARWHNMLAKSKAQARDTHSNKLLISGNGYIENLELRINPLKMPLKELRWGHFSHENIAVVWISWLLKNGQSKQWLFVNNNLYQDRNIRFSSTGMQFDNGSIEHLLATKDIRYGNIKNTALSKNFCIKKLLPNSLLNIYEHKRLILAKLTIQNIIYEGWIIDEIVIFP